MKWNVKEENLTVEITQSRYLEKSGMYACEITKVEDFKSPNSKAEALSIEFLTTETNEKFRVRHFYLNKDGEEVNFSKKLIDKLMYILNLTDTDELKGKKIIVDVDVKVDGQYHNYNVREYFDWKTCKTSKEIKENLPPDTYKRRQGEPEKIVEYFEDKNDFPF